MKTHLLAATLFIVATGAAVTAPPADAQSRRSQHQVCRDVQTKQIQSKDDNRLIGTGVGAVAGGLLGNQVGGGKGKTLATVAGAVGGGYAGNQIQKNHQNKNATYETHRECHWVND
ncbi:glycine zipper 2TM domain-containing protein [Luteibacter sp. 9135]|uniref:glycine zipper 2TM domain-containing protein n=1 Tax=Luteibacter sp. 9135 TaxID=1500893 RepID=UPI00056CF0DB|nr:glycine zipper 2TM domain-containing protein [Luteibacter sp. 9135]